MLGSATAMQGLDHRIPASDGALAGIQADRDRLTHLLRGLANELDGLDRRLSEITWQRARPTGAAVGDMCCERTALQSQRGELTARLHMMAGQLNHLNLVLSDLRGHDQLPTARVGTCPHCGYPSLGSGLCAYCRPHLLAD